MTLLYKADPVRGAEWQALFTELAPDVPLRIWPDVGDPADVRYLAAWEHPIALIEHLPNLKVLFSLGAGVDQFDLGRLPASIDLVRLIDPGIIAGMVEYVTFATLALHRQILDYRRAQDEARWAPMRGVPAQDRRVGVLGLGVLGQAVAASLRALGFPLYGWNRSPRNMEGVTCFYGQDQFALFLGCCDILICLLPLTSETRGVLNREAFAALRPGAGLVNVGRGGHLVEQDLLAALESGHLSGAVLDVMADEPPRSDHPFWGHPRIILTPHIASTTHPQSAARAMIDNIRRHQAGAPMHGLVRRNFGY